MTIDSMEADEIAHLLVTNEGNPIRVHLQESDATIPTEPCGRASPPTTDVPLQSFEAIVEHASIEDGGLTLLGAAHLSESEWRRAGLQTHWNDEDARTDGEQRYLELWASREGELYETDTAEYGDFRPAVPGDSPIITEWKEHSPDDEPDAPPVPLEQPTLDVHTAYTDRATRRHNVGFNRVTVGRVAAVEVLDDLETWPTKREMPSRDVSPPSKHPAIDYSELDALPPEPDTVEAVFTINRHAKRLGNEAAEMYAADRGADARVHSVRQSALYAVKTIALHRFAKDESPDLTLEKHVIDGAPFWCFYIGEEFSFHQPPEAVSNDLLDDVTDADGREDIERQTIDYERSTDVDQLDRSLEDALQTLWEVGLDANHHLSGVRHRLQQKRGAVRRVRLHTRA